MTITCRELAGLASQLPVGRGTGPPRRPSGRAGRRVTDDPCEVTVGPLTVPRCRFRPLWPSQSNNSSIKCLDGIVDLVFPFSREYAVAQHLQFDKVVPLFVENRKILALLDEVDTRQACKAVLAGQKGA